MATQDKSCSIAPYFTIPEDKVSTAREMFDKFVEKTSSEPGCLYYGFSFKGNEVHCREAYVDGDAALAHLANVGALLGEFLKIAEMTRLEVHGPEEELAKLRGPLADLKPQFYVLEYGFRK